MAAKRTTPPEERQDTINRLEPALAPIQKRLDIHGEMLTRIIQLLTEEKASDEPSLYKLLADLITRIDGQSRYLMELTFAFGKLGMNLPLDLVHAIDDNLDVGHRRDRHTALRHSFGPSAAFHVLRTRNLLLLRPPA